MRWTRKSLSLRLAKRKFILFLVLMDTGQGRTLLLSAFSTTDTCGAEAGLRFRPPGDALGRSPL